MPYNGIPIVDARQLYTKYVIDVYKNRPRPTNFLTSFFQEKFSATKEISIEVQRGWEQVAVDVERGTQGNRNKISLSSEKTFLPPYYREFFDITELSHYDFLYSGDSSGSVGDGLYSDFVETSAERLLLLQDKIDRAYELQVSNVFQTGIVDIKASNAVTIDFKRKAASFIDLGASGYWDKNPSVDPALSLIQACTFIRTIGKGMGGKFNAILGENALMALIGSDGIQNRGKIFNWALDLITPPERVDETIGCAFHGTISAGSWRVNLYTYPQFYDDNNKNPQPYIEPYNVIVIPEKTDFTAGFASVPLLVEPGMPSPKGKYFVMDVVDQRLSAHEFIIKSAGLMIPKAVDQIFTIKATSV